MNKLIYAVLPIIIFSIISCGNIKSYLDIATNKGISKDYLEVLNHWTRKDVLYSQFETKVIITATYKSDAFYKGYLKEYARIYNLNDEEIKRREEMLYGFPSAPNEFFFYASMADKEANDFEKANSIWKIFLIDKKGNRIDPSEIRKIDKVPKILEEFFPYVNKYHGNCYILKFLPIAAKEENGGGKTSMKLVFASVLGRVEQVWP